jgi:hypothetical protein
MQSTHEDRERVKEMEGLYVGMLDPNEIEILDRCISDGVAIKDYNHAGGILGLAKIKTIRNT